MTAYSDTFTFGGVTLQVLSIKAVERQKQRKMVIGKKLTMINILGIDAYQTNIDMSVLITGTSLTDLYANRDAIEALNDLAVHAYVDGRNDGNYYMVPTSYSIDDSGERGNASFIANFSLVEE